MIDHGGEPAAPRASLKRLSDGRAVIVRVELGVHGRVKDGGRPHWGDGAGLVDKAHGDLVRANWGHTWVDEGVGAGPD